MLSNMIRLFLLLFFEAIRLFLKPVNLNFFQAWKVQKRSTFLKRKCQLFKFPNLNFFQPFHGVCGQKETGEFFRVLINPFIVLLIVSRSSIFYISNYVDDIGYNENRIPKAWVPVNPCSIQSYYVWCWLTWHGICYFVLKMQFNGMYELYRQTSLGYCSKCVGESIR